MTTRKERLMAALSVAVEEIGFQPPLMWTAWIVRLLDALHYEASAERYEEFLRSLKGAITARLEDGRWWKSYWHSYLSF